MNEKNIVSIEDKLAVVRAFLATESIDEVVRITGISEVTVRRILLTLGLWISPMCARIEAEYKKLAKTGYTEKEKLEKVSMAKGISISPKSVQQQMPYADGIDFSTLFEVEFFNDEEYEALKRIQHRVCVQKMLYERELGYFEYPQMVQDLLGQENIERLEQYSKNKKIKQLMGKNLVLRLHLELRPARKKLERLHCRQYFKRFRIS